MGRVVSEICERTDKQTNRHTNKLIAILHTPTLSINNLCRRFKTRFNR